MGKLQFRATGLRRGRRDDRETEDRSRRTAAASILAALLVLLATIPQGDEPPGDIVATSNALVFPNTLVGTQSQRPLTLTLTGLSGSMMSFQPSGLAENFEVDDGCIAAPANASCFVSVTFRPRKEGAHTATLRILDDRQTQLEEVALSGNGVKEPPPLVASPNPLIFPETSVGKASKRALTLALTGLSGSMMSLHLSGSGRESFELDDGCKAAPVNTTCSVSVTFIPREKGAHTATLKILDDRQTQLEEVAFSGSGATTPRDVVATPNPLNLPDTRAGQRSQRPLTLALSGLSGSMMSFRLSGPGTESFEIDDGCRAAPASTSCSVLVAFHPLTEGSHAATLRILDETGAQLEQVVLRGAGLPPPPLTASISPNPAPMSPQEVGVSNGGYPIRITNTSAVPFDIGYQAPPGAIQVRGVCASTRLSPKDSCTEMIDFTPSAKGAFSQQIGVLLNGAQRYTLVVSGTGTQAQVNVVPALAFTSGRETRSIAVANVGDAPLRITSAVVTGDQRQFRADVGACIAAHVPAGQSCQIRVAVLTDTRMTLQQAVLRVTDNAPGSPRSINVQADPYFAKVVANPSSLDFGEVIVGVSSDLSVDLTNTGNAPTGQLRISAGGGFAVVDSGCQQLGPGESCGMTIRFTPASPQSYDNNNVTLHSQTGEWSVLLRGQGVPRPPEQPIG